MCNLVHARAGVALQLVARSSVLRFASDGMEYVRSFDIALHRGPTPRPTHLRLHGPCSESRAWLTSAVFL